MKRPTSILNTQVFWLTKQVAEHLAFPDKVRGWPDAEKIRQAETDLVAWAAWLQANRASITADEWQLHDLTLRWAKGVLKLWRMALNANMPGPEKARQLGG
jgi:hypothetical protein